MSTSNYSTSEVGHAKNIANLQKMISYLQNFGTQYNPLNPEISIVSLQTKLIDAQKAVEKLHHAKGEYIIAVNNRQKAFEDLSKTATRIGNALSSITTDKRIIADAKTFINKIRGRAPKTKTKDNEEGQEIKPERSNAQLSFDNRINHFQGLIELLASISLYTPNEPDIAVPQLRLYLQELQNQNQTIIPFQVQYSQKLIDRNQILYNPANGIIICAKQVKLYIRSVFGTNSTQYGLIKPLEFRTFKR